MTALSDVAYGLVIGLTLGLTGGGGSIITLPVLVYLVGENVQTAIATALGIVGAIAAQGALLQLAAIRWRAGSILAACGFIGAIPGSALSPSVPGNVLLLLFAATMLVAAVMMLRGRREREAVGSAAAAPAVAAAGLGLGVLTGFLGVGGGFLIVPTLVALLGLPMRNAIATSLFVIALNAASSVAAHAFAGSIDVAVSVLFVVGGLVGNAAGMTLGRRLAQTQLKRIFAIFVLGVALFTGASAGGLLPFHVR